MNTYDATVVSCCDKQYFLVLNVLLVVNWRGVGAWRGGGGRWWGGGGGGGGGRGGEGGGCCSMRHLIAHAFDRPYRPFG